jgi:hypothetical protein
MRVFTNEIAEAVGFNPVDLVRSDQLKSPVLIALFEYWNRLRGDRFAPARKDVKPSDIPALLPHILIFEVLEGGARARVRLAGSAISQYLDPNFTGAVLDDASPLLAVRRNLAGIRAAARDRIALTCSWDVTGLPGLSFKSSEVIWLPLSLDGRTVDQILASFWLVQKQRTAPRDFKL